MSLNSANALIDNIDNTFRGNFLAVYDDVMAQIDEANSRGYMEVEFKRLKEDFDAGFIDAKKAFVDICMLRDNPGMFYLPIHISACLSGVLTQ